MFSRASLHTIIKNLFLLSWFPPHCSTFCAVSFQFRVVVCLSYYGLTVLCICLVLACFMFLPCFGLPVRCFCETVDQLCCFCLVMINCTVSVRFWIDFYVSVRLQVNCFMFDRLWIACFPRYQIF